MIPESSTGSDHNVDCEASLYTALFGRRMLTVFHPPYVQEKLNETYADAKVTVRLLSDGESGHGYLLPVIMQHDARNQMWLDGEEKNAVGDIWLHSCPRASQCCLSVIMLSVLIRDK